MKHFAGLGIRLSVVFAAILGATLLCSQQAQATTSPYVTSQTDVPLNQSTNDTINGVLPYFNSHDAQESGTFSTFVDATSANAPTGNVIPGPDDTWVGVAWDFGDPGADFIWRLDRIDLWIAGFDDLRRGIQADFSVSSSGDVNDFSIIPNSKHWAGLTQNSQYNYVRYDFPRVFVPNGSDTTMDKYPVYGFRYLRLNSIGDGHQSRFVEADMWATKVPLKPTITSVTRNSGGDVNLTWTCIPGRTYNVEYKTNVSSGWNPLTTVVADAETESALDASTSGSERYYRVALQP